MDSAVPGKQTVRVTIFNQSYTLRAAASAAETEALAARVDELMSTIAARTGSGDPARVAVLACLHLADRLRSLEQRLKQIEHWCASRVGPLSAMLDEVIEPDSSKDAGG